MDVREDGEVERPFHFVKIVSASCMPIPVNDLPLVRFAFLYDDLRRRGFRGGMQ